ncbi:D-3-phosphoglycerate dehydrogenase [Cryptococcus gattii Ru294]|nr:D-3-phosphoglycerate dehydrogenase [Cryptococcus gattii Ru294]
MAISPSINGQNNITNGLTDRHQVDGNDGTSGTHAKPRVFALDPLHSEALTFAEKHFDLVLPGDEGADQWREEAQGLLVRGSYVTAEDLERAASTNGGKLKYISKQGTGVDKIDTVNARKLGIPVMNTPGVNAQAVAELAFGMMLSLARQTPSIDRRIRKGASVTKLDGWKGQMLYGKTLGVIGGGNIGLLVAKMFAGAFSGKIVLYDPYLKSLDTWHAAIPNTSIHKVLEIDELLTTSDIVTIHVPLTPSTENMISASQFKIMKPTAILINTARGGIINEEDLAQALLNEEIFAAGLDAFNSEPPNLARYPDLCASRILELHANLFSRLRASRWFKISSMPLKARWRIGYVKKLLGFSERNPLRASHHGMSNFYPPPRIVTARAFSSVPTTLWSTKTSDWLPDLVQGSGLPPKIFLEGPTTDTQGNLFVTDVPYGRILRCELKSQVWEVLADYEGEASGLALNDEGYLIVADYKNGLMKCDPKTGKVDPILLRRNMERFKGTNDVIVARNGDIYGLGVPLVSHRKTGYAPTERYQPKWTCVKPRGDCEKATCSSAILHFCQYSSLRSMVSL